MDPQPHSDIAPADVREQLERIVTDPLFTHSKRYPSFLRYVVTHTVEGQSDQLKERTLGIEVFGREPDYDTNLDNVVRTTAAEIRKRLAQYYQGDAHRDELRVELPAGSYVPRFHWPPKEAPAEVPAPAVAPAPAAAAAVSSTVVPTRLPHWLLPVAAVLVLALGTGWWFTHRETALDRFWGPVINGQNSVLLCTGTVQSLRRMTDGQDATPDPVGASASPTDTRRHVALVEATALVRLGSLLNIKGKNFRLRDDLSVSLPDLKDAPVVMLGGMNNQWTQRLTAPLRFSFHWERSTNTTCILDSQHTDQRTWCKDNAVTPDKIREDYALVGRFQDATTGQWSILSAGLYRYGTMAAAEFLTDPTLLAEFAASAPRGWESRNVELVLATKVLDNNAARPRVIATHIW